VSVTAATPDVDDAAAAAPTSKATNLLQRVILPRAGEPLDVRSLYLIESASNSRRAHAPTRTSVLLGAESEVSFETYFNGFAASYWRRWSVLTSVVLRVEVRGDASRGQTRPDRVACRVDVYRSKSDGSRIGIEGGLVYLDDDNRGVVEFEVDLGPFEDGGWIWFDITSDIDIEVLAAGWYTSVDPPAGPDSNRITVGIPTFNRPMDAVNALRALTSDPLVDQVIDAVMMPDQGTRRVSDEPGFTEAAAALGDRFHLFEQPNLGGSGGYSRRQSIRAVHGRRHLHRTGLRPARACDVSVRQDPDVGRRADAEPAGPQPPALHG
jgi:galactofuranosylgalactofuranosylrhamnosyl-N-acetylglucosaminyl-diphospho-decaprenol beta-1,5/1,6-galactofuranosyltransferase